MKRGIILYAKALIDSPEKWIQGIVACDKDGLVCNARDLRACRFSAASALARANADLNVNSDIAWQVKRLVRDVIDTIVPGQNLWVCDFNDLASTKHEDVMNVLDRAASLTT